jgi:hypothetical protein
MPPQVAELKLDALLVNLLAGAAGYRGGKYAKESHGERARSEEQQEGPPTSTSLDNGLGKKQLWMELS